MAELATDYSPGEWRAVLFEDGEPVSLHIGRTGRAALGSVHEARILSNHAGGAFVGLGGGEEALLSPAPKVAEGASVRVDIIREAMAAPGEIKLAMAHVTDAATTKLTDAQIWDARIAALGATPVSAGLLDDYFDLAFAGRSEIAGGTIWFERTKAGLVFDVDATGDASAVNDAAAREVARLLRLFGVGGSAMIDFISTDNKAARLAIGAAFDEAAAADPRPFERTAVNGYGLMQVVRAKRQPSILDTLFGARRVSASDETQLLQLLRDAARSTGFGARRIVTRPALATQLGSPGWQPLVEEAARIIGAPLEIVAEPGITGYGHVHVSQS